MNFRGGLRFFGRSFGAGQNFLGPRLGEGHNFWTPSIKTFGDVRVIMGFVL